MSEHYGRPSPKQITCDHCGRPFYPKRDNYFQEGNYFKCRYCDFKNPVKEVIWGNSGSINKIIRR